MWHWWPEVEYFRKSSTNNNGNDERGVGLFANNCAVPALRNRHIESELFHSLFTSYSVPDIEFQKTTVAVSGSRYRVGGVVLDYGLNVWGNIVGFPAGKNIYIFSNASRSDVAPPSLQWVPRAFSLGVSSLGLGVNYSSFLGLRLRTDVAIGTVPLAFMACTSNKFTC